MQIPALPTDDLYKFMALGGITVMIFSVYFYWTFSRRLWERMDELTLDLNLMDVDIEDAEERVKEAKKEQPVRPETEERLSQLLLEIRRRHATHKVKNQIIKRLLRELSVIGVLAIGGFGYGGVLATRGFSMWSKETQAHSASLPAQAK